MYFTIYKITNLLDGKFYIGKHQTKNLDDGYFGSGKLLGRAIRKHGKENFKKEILEVHDTEEAMNAAEARLVVLSKDSYNLCEGGNGGFGYINSKGLANHENLKLGSAVANEVLKKKRKDPTFQKNISQKISDTQKLRHSKIKDYSYLKKENWKK